MDLNDVVQALNELKTRVGGIGDSTWHGLATLSSTIDARINQLNDTLMITNILLGLLVLSSIFNIILKLRKNKKDQ